MSKSLITMTVLSFFMLTQSKAQQNYYQDFDNDGFGNPNNVIVASEQPEGYVPNALDCNDLDAQINPDSPEICDDVDNNCNAEVDELPNCIDPFDKALFYQELNILRNQGTDCSNGNFYSTQTILEGSQLLEAAAQRHADDMAENNFFSHTGSDGTDYRDRILDTGYPFRSGTELVANSLGPLSPSQVLDLWASSGQSHCNLLFGDFGTGSLVEFEDVSIAKSSNGNQHYYVLLLALEESNLQTFFADIDRDGYGDPLNSIDATDRPENYVTNNLDCDDNNSTVNPFSPEVCDNLDNNCNGDIDEELNCLTIASLTPEFISVLADSEQVPFFIELNRPITSDSDGEEIDVIVSINDEEPETITLFIPGGQSSTFFSLNPTVVGTYHITAQLNGYTKSATMEVVGTQLNLYYADADQDGFGDPNNSIEASERPDGFVDDNTDCDDTNVAINPSAVDVVDGIDNDCDGLVDNFGCNDNARRVNFDSDEDINEFAFLNNVEGWEANQFEQVEIANGNLKLVPFTSTWFQDYRGPFIFQDIDLPSFSVTTKLTVNNRSGDGTLPRLLSLAGLGIRTAKSFPNGALTDWIPGDENHVLLAIGSATQPGQIFTSSTIASQPSLETQSLPEISDITLKMVKIDEMLYSYFSLDGEVFTQISEYQRGDFPENLQVGLVAFTDFEGISLGPLDFNSTVVDANPDLVAYIDFFDVKAVNSLDEAFQDQANLQDWYRDADMDGFGDENVTIKACTKPVGYVSDNTDCDDSNSIVNPATVEECDNLDNNCNGEIDEDLDCVVLLSLEPRQESITLGELAVFNLTLADPIPENYGGINIDFTVTINDGEPLTVTEQVRGGESEKLFPFLPNEIGEATLTASFEDQLLISFITIEAPVSQSCEPLRVISFDQGRKKNYRRVSHRRSNPEKALGEPQENDTYNFVSLGFGGSITFELEEELLDNGSAEPDFIIVETSFGRADDMCYSSKGFRYPEEAFVEVSFDNQNWYSLPNSICRTSFIDIKPAVDKGLQSVRYIKVTDITDRRLHRWNADGFDIDGLILCPDEVQLARERLLDARITGEALFDPAFVNRAPNEEAETSLEIFPNPAERELSIRLISENFATSCLELYNTAGSKVLSRKITVKPDQQIYTLDISSLASGIFIYRFVQEDFVATGKLIRQ